MYQFILLFLLACIPQLSLHAETTNPPQTEQTLSIIKPDAVENMHIGEIITRFEKNGLRVVGIKMVHLTPEKAGDFYIEHKERPFYKDLVSFMTSGPVVVIVLDGPNAIAKNREIMGATDPKAAAAGTLRADFAESKSKNAVHGSDSPAAAKREIPFFFTTDELR